jgi:quercetin dioxygenase-like cupin family protein
VAVITDGVHDVKQDICPHGLMSRLGSLCLALACVPLVVLTGRSSFQSPSIHIQEDQEVRARSTSALLAVCVIGGGALAAYGQSLDPKRSSSVHSDAIDFEPFSAFPQGARLAVVVGEPKGPGPYVVRVNVPEGVKLMPHVHPEDRIYTVISGVFYIGYGNTFDESKLIAYGPGDVVVLPANTPHFHWARSGSYVTQVTGTGPLGLRYLDPKDDPRTQGGK